MQTEYYQFQLTKTEALECLRAFLSQALMEEEVRLQQGLEPPELSPLLTRFVQLLGISDEQIEQMTDRASEELWEYSWYVFTNEWAWFRARQEALRLKGKGVKPASPPTNQEDHHKIAEQLYKRHFERYVNELNMRTLSNNRVKSQAPKRKNLRSNKE